MTISDAPATAQSEKIIDPARIDAWRDSVRERKIVFTNGCFDLLHVGHLRYLWEARRLGDLLIIGVNDDASIRRLKGEKRPVLKLHERAAILAGLRCVDYVTWFSEDTPAELIARIQPDVLVKGASYDVSEIAGRETVEARGGKVLTVAMTEGKSTSAIIEKIQAMKK